MTPLTLVNLVNNAGFDPVVYQDLDAAGRALLQHDDAAPLLRLAALSLGFDDTNEPLPGFSDGLYFAVSCTDYVQLFDRSAPPAVRHRQYRAALRREPAGTFAPFSVAQWTSMDQYTEAYSACLDWPDAGPRNPPITRRPPLVPPRLPVLILSGTLDSLTPRLDGATLVARQMGRSARLVTLANLTHVTEQDGNSALRDVDLPALRPRSRRPAQREHLVRGPGGPDPHRRQLPAAAAQAVPATPLPGNRAGRQALPRRLRGAGQRGRRDQPLAAAQRRPRPRAARRPDHLLRRHRPADHPAWRALGQRRRHRWHARSGTSRPAGSPPGSPCTRTAPRRCG